jgi:hypothetical protein
MTENFMILFRPVNDKELELIKASDYNRFPPRLPEQPILFCNCIKEERQARLIYNQGIQVGSQIILYKKFKCDFLI